MARRQKKNEEASEDWLTTYADAITLLMCFFVILLSVCEPKTEKLEALMEKMASGFVENMIELPFKQLYEDFQLIIEDNAVELQVATEYTSEGVQLDLAASAIFSPGSAEIRPDAVQMLKEMSISVQEMDLKDFVVVVEGHTDDTAVPRGSAFPSNWELSAVRAARIVRFMIDQGVPSGRMQAVAYADTKPKVPNLDIQGNPIPDNREQNRRVLINIKRVL